MAENTLLPKNAYLCGNYRKINQAEISYIMEKIDALDKRILDIVTRNARIPSKDIAVECGVSRAAIHQRIQRLIDVKVIVGSGYRIDARALGFQTCTYIGIRLERGNMYRSVVKCLESIPEVVECHFTTGPYTMLCKLYARDNEHLMELLNHRIQGIEGVVSTETLISLEESIRREISICGGTLPNIVAFTSDDDYID
jgi:Lrp/AsnC family transcriptional regulator for asnA, asnC and gidA